MNSLTERRKAILFLILATLLWSTAGVFVKVCERGNSYSTKRVSCETLFVFIPSFSLSSYQDVPLYRWQSLLPERECHSVRGRSPRHTYPSG